MSDGLAVAVRKAGGTRVKQGHVATDHSWSDSRKVLEWQAISWLRTLR